MRWFVTTVAGLAMVFVCGEAVAQNAAAEIRAHITEGEKVSLKTDDGKQVKGRVKSVGTDLLIVEGRNKSAFTVKYDQVTELNRQADSVRNGALIGLAVGVALGAAAASSADGSSPGTFCGMAIGSTCDRDSRVAAFIAPTAFGALVGATVDAWIHRRDLRVYRRPTPTRVSLLPMIAGGRRSVALSYAW